MQEKHTKKNITDKETEKSLTLLEHCLRDPPKKDSKYLHLYSIANAHVLFTITPKVLRLLMKTFRGKFDFCNNSPVYSSRLDGMLYQTLLSNHLKDLAWTKWIRHCPARTIWSSIFRPLPWTDFVPELIWNQSSMIEILKSISAHRSSWKMRHTVKSKAWGRFCLVTCHIAPKNINKSTCIKTSTKNWSPI